LVVWRLDRLGRTLGDLIELTNQIQSHRIDLESLSEKLNTGSPTGKTCLSRIRCLGRVRKKFNSRTLGAVQHVSPLLMSFLLRSVFGPRLEGTGLSPYPLDNGSNITHLVNVFQQNRYPTVFDRVEIHLNMLICGAANVARLSTTSSEDLAFRRSYTQAFASSIKAPRLAL
jgi:hypothetical protein